MPLLNQAESAKAVTELNAWKNNTGVNQVLKEYKYPYFVWNCEKPYRNTSDFFLNWCNSSPRFAQAGNAEILCVSALEKVGKASFVPRWSTDVAVWAEAVAEAGSDPLSVLSAVTPNTTRFYLLTLSYSHSRGLCPGLLSLW